MQSIHKALKCPLGSHPCFWLHFPNNQWWSLFICLWVICMSSLATVCFFMVLWMSLLAPVRCVMCLGACWGDCAVRIDLGRMFACTLTARVFPALTFITTHFLLNLSLVFPLFPCYVLTLGVLGFSSGSARDCTWKCRNEILQPLTWLSERTRGGTLVFLSAALRKETSFHFLFAFRYSEKSDTLLLGCSG